MLSLAKPSAGGLFDSPFIFLSSATRAKKNHPVLRILRRDTVLRLVKN
jgi:hypothetical protein